MNYHGNRLETRIDTSLAYYSGNIRYMDGNMARIIGLQGLQGETTEELAEMLDRGEFLISDYDIAHNTETQEKIQLGCSLWVRQSVASAATNTNSYTAASSYVLCPKTRLPGKLP